MNGAHSSDYKQVQYPIFWIYFIKQIFFVSSHIYPEKNTEGTRVIGSVNMGNIKILIY